MTSTADLPPLQWGIWVPAHPARALGSAAAEQVDERGILSDAEAYAGAGQSVDGSWPGRFADHSWHFLVQAAVDLGVGSVTATVSWPELQPAGTGELQQAAVDELRAALDQIESAGLAARLVLSNGTVPVPLMLDGGWLNRATAEHFGSFAGVLGQIFRDRVETWYTTADAATTALHGYAFGIAPPGLTLLGGAAVATHHLQLAHGLATAALREAGARRVGLIAAVSPVRSASADPADHAAAALFDRLQHKDFSVALADAEEPTATLDAPDLPGADRSAERLGDRAVITAEVDVLGLSYSHPVTIAAAPDNPRVPFTMVDEPELPRTPSGLPICPNELTTLLQRVSRELDTEIDVFLDLDEQPEPDAQEPDTWLLDHIDAICRARNTGARIAGITVRPLIDGWDGSDGLTRRRGLIGGSGEQLHQRRPAFGHYATVIAATAVPSPAGAEEKTS